MCDFVVIYESVGFRSYLGLTLQNVRNIQCKCEIAISIPTVVKGRELQNSLGEGAHKTLIKVKFENEYLTELSILYRDSTE